MNSKLITKNTKNRVLKVRSIIEEVVPIPDDEWEYGKQFLYTKDFDKNSFLVKAGEITEHSYIIIKGLTRSFYILKNGKEFTSSFGMEKSITGSFSSMVLQQPSRFFIQALEDTETVVLTRSVIEKLYDRHHCWERYGRLMAEYNAINNELKDGEILDSLETRYLKFLKDYHDLIKRIPQYLIASYLGVTDVALSRLRKRINII